MPTVTEEPVRAYAHCTNPMCDGYAQQEVDGVKTLAEYTFRENGGSQSPPGVESSRSYVRFADEGLRPCPVCSLKREVTDQPRKNIAPLSGHDQNGLLMTKPFNAQVVNTADDQRFAELAAANAKLAARVEELE